MRIYIYIYIYIYIVCRLFQVIGLHKLREDGANTSNILSSKETVIAIMMLYSNTKVKVHSPDGYTDFFDVVAGDLQGDTLTSYLLIICLDCSVRWVCRINRLLLCRGGKTLCPTSVL